MMVGCMTTCSENLHGIQLTQLCGVQEQLRLGEKRVPVFDGEVSSCNLLVKSWFNFLTN